jgi:hypothetical protein
VAAIYGIRVEISAACEWTRRYLCRATVKGDFAMPGIHHCTWCQEGEDNLGHHTVDRRLVTDDA